MSKKDYHHGNLKNALKQASLDLVEEYGPQAFTLAATTQTGRSFTGSSLPTLQIQGRVAADGGN